MISDEAVEAAAMVEWLRLTSGNVAPTGRWEDQPDYYLDWLRNNARAMLEAAAPYMQQFPPPPTEPYEPHGHTG